MSQPDYPTKPHRSGLGTFALLVLGLLILIPSGLCTGFVGFVGLQDMIEHPSGQGYGILFVGGAAILGLPFVVAGLVMVWLGVRRMRAR